jgi:chromosome transmission fidelity protein 4
MFSTGGLQGPVIWLKGDPVTMVGRGSFLAVIYHEGNPLFDGTQVLAYSLYDAVNFKLVSTGSVDAISSCGSLTWAGFSNDYSLLIKDSEGMVSMLSCHDLDTRSSWLWTPILDTTIYQKSSEDVFWPVSVENGKLTTLHLKGGDKHPDPVRRPITIFLDLHMPLVGSMLDKGYVHV